MCRLSVPRESSTCVLIMRYIIFHPIIQKHIHNSLKESVYKAMHPILCEYVGFQEAEITPLPDGTAHVILNLQSGSHERMGIVVRSTSWRRLEDGKFFLTTALIGVG